MKSLIFKDKKIVPSLVWRSLRWHLNYLLKKTPLPLACGLYITNRCNLKCNFCNIWRKPAGITLSFEKAKNIVNSLSDFGCFYFSVTGGEPLLAGYIYDLLEYARKSRIKYIHLVTNGSLLDKKSAKRLKKAGVNEVSVSIDAAEEIHDKNRGAAGSYAKAIKAVENLKRYAPDVTVVLNAILLPETPFECLHAVELAHRFAVYAKVQPLNQHPRFSEESFDMGAVQDINREKLREVVSRLRNDRHVVNSDVFLENMYNFYCNKEKLIFKDSACVFGYHHIEILEDGSVFPCLEGLDWEGGMNFDGSLKDVIFSRDYIENLERLKNCKNCRRNYYICYYEPRIAFPVLKRS